jgi:hypothetical protein
MHRRLSLLLLITACSDDFVLPSKGGADDTDVVVDGTDFCAVQSIFAARCLNCHGSAALGDLDLGTDAYAALVDVPSAQNAAVKLVVPGDPAASMLYQKVTGTQTDGGSMPPGSTLVADEAEVIRAWIADGADGACDEPIDTDVSPTAYHPEGFADPAMHGHDAKYQVQACTDCHGADLTGAGEALSCDTCHAAGWRSDCTFCHGDPTEGTGAPPVHISGEDDGVDASFIPHLAHVQQSEIKRALDCAECHVKPADVLTAGHLFVGDDSPGVAEVSFALGLSDAATWNGNGGCSNLYCHGNGRGDNGTIQHTGAVSTCHDCHPDASSTDDAWDRMSGEHKKHLEEPGVACVDCHADTTNAAQEITGLALHINGQPDVALRQGMSRTYERCSGNCHGEGHNNRAW